MKILHSRSFPARHPTTHLIALELNDYQLRIWHDEETGFALKLKHAQEPWIPLKDLDEFEKFTGWASDYQTGIRFLREALFGLKDNIMIFDSMLIFPVDS